VFSQANQAICSGNAQYNWGVLKTDKKIRQASPPCSCARNDSFGQGRKRGISSCAAEAGVPPSFVSDRRKKIIPSRNFHRIYRPFAGKSHPGGTKALSRGRQENGKMVVHILYGNQGNSRWAMGVLPDWQIQRDIKIVPFADGAHRPGTISYGLTSYGYDVRVGRKFKVFTNARCAVVDPKNFDPASFVDIEGDYCLIPPNSFALAETVEFLEIPRDIICLCVGKSTFARCGIIVNVTPLEPEWRGRITIEISNTTPLPAKIYAGEGIAQILFLRAEAVCQTSYADKKGKYQDQKGLTLPFVIGSNQTK
jgi:dCTP deaminase